MFVDAEVLLLESLERLASHGLERRVGTNVDGEPRAGDARSEDANGDRYGDLGVGFTISGKVGSDKRLLRLSCSCHDGDSLTRSQEARGEQIAARPGLCDTSTMKICSVLRRTCPVRARI